jgi:hypothetical protein
LVAKPPFAPLLAASAFPSTTPSGVGQERGRPKGGGEGSGLPERLAFLATALSGPAGGASCYRVVSALLLELLLDLLGLLLELGELLQGGLARRLFVV